MYPTIYYLVYLVIFAIINDRVILLYLIEKFKFSYYLFLLSYYYNYALTYHIIFMNTNIQLLFY